MASEDSGPRATALDFATTTFGDEVTAGERDELLETLRELKGYFGAPALIRAISDLDLARVNNRPAFDPVTDALRNYSCLILDEPIRPMLVVKLVGKLSHMELTTGKRIRLSDLARSEGISKQAVSKRMAIYAEKLKLPRPDSTEEAREAHRQQNRRNYAS